MTSTQTVEIKGRGNHWHVYYPNEERLASPFPVYDREGEYKTTLWCGSDTNGMTSAHFEGSRDEAIAYALYLVPGASLSVTRTSTPAERMAVARKAKEAREVSTALTSNGRDLEKFEAALNTARAQREEDQRLEAEATIPDRYCGG